MFIKSLSPQKILDTKYRMQRIFKRSMITIRSNVAEIRLILCGTQFNLLFNVYVISMNTQADDVAVKMKCDIKFGA